MFFMYARRMVGYCEFSANASQMCKVFNGDMNINATDVPTHLVIEYFRSFNAVAWTMAKKKADREGKPDDYWS